LIATEREGQLLLLVHIFISFSAARLLTFQQVYPLTKVGLLLLLLLLLLRLLLLLHLLLRLLLLLLLLLRRFVICLETCLGSINSQRYVSVGSFSCSFLLAYHVSGDVVIFVSGAY
jgi:hypothetical protein